MGSRFMSTSKNWYIRAGDDVRGPLTREVLIQLIMEQKLSKEIEALPEGGEWKKIGEYLEELSGQPVVVPPVEESGGGAEITLEIDFSDEEKPAVAEASDPEESTSHSPVTSDLPSPPVDERRIGAPRISVFGEVESDQGPSGKLVNLSMSGAFIATDDDQFEVGAKFIANFHLEGLPQPFQAQLEIMRKMMDPKWTKGYGCRYLDLKEIQMQAVAKVIGFKLVQ